MPRKLTPEGRERPQSGSPVEDETGNKVLDVIGKLADGISMLTPAGAGPTVAKYAAPMVRGKIPERPSTAAVPQPPQYGPRPPAYEAPPPASAGIEGTTEMAQAFESGPAPIKLPGGGEVTVTAQGAANMMKYPWATAAIMDPAGFIKDNPKIAKIFTDKRTGKLDIEAIKSFEQSRVQEEEAGVEPDFSLAGRKSFEDEVYKRVGGNPFTFNPKSAVDDSSRFLPDLFNEVFQRQVAWEDRDKLNEEEEGIWQAEQRRFRAEIRNKAIAKNAQSRQMYSAMMDQWDAAAGRAKLSKEARVALEKAQVKRPFELEKVERQAGEKKTTSFQTARRELRQQLESSLFKGKPMVGEEDRKLYNATLKRFDELRVASEGGKIDINPAAAIKKAQDDVNEILDIFWSEYNSAKGDKETQDKVTEDVRSLLGYVPLTQRS